MPQNQTGAGSSTGSSARSDVSCGTAGPGAGSSASQTAGNSSLWGGRFEKHPTDFLVRFGASLPVDKRMWREDIQGSLAHARMLAQQGIITEEDRAAIASGLADIAARIEAGSFDFDINDEDIHMAIERNLTQAIGGAGGRLHTGRSRNDQVATDGRLLARNLARGLHAGLLSMRRVLVDLAQEHLGVVMPGYTHLQKAQPVLFSHHMLAYYWMFERDCRRVRQAYDSADVLALGSAALAGTTYALDRQAVADELGFAQVSANSLDTVSDRDFFCDLVYACAMIQMHLSRLCEELILWSTGEFGFVTMDDAYSTGSSIMPQKKNPDFAELTRGKTGRVYGDLLGLLTMLKGLPLAYDKDLQEDKEGVFDAVDTVSDGLQVCAGMLASMQVNAQRMRQDCLGGFMVATDVADYLVGKGLPFRRAHEVVGRIVLWCEKQHRTLQDMTLDDYLLFSDLFDASVADAVDIDKTVAARSTQGGTGHSAVKDQLSQALGALERDASWGDSASAGPADSGPVAGD